MDPRRLTWKCEARGHRLVFHELVACDTPKGVDQGQQSDVGRFQEVRNRHSGSLDKRIDLRSS